MPVSGYGMNPGEANYLLEVVINDGMPVHSSLRVIEINAHVSTRHIQQIRSPFDDLQNRKKRLDLIDTLHAKHAILGG
jgi:hypothetical protein